MNFAKKRAKLENRRPG